MKKFLFCSLLVFNVLCAQSVEPLARNVVAELDAVYNIDKNIILAYIKTESNFEAYPLAIKTNTPQFAKIVFKSYGFRTKVNKNYVSVFPDSPEQAELAYDLLAYNKTKLGVEDYDFGIMQINTRNAKRWGVDERALYLDVAENMKAGAFVMRSCFDLLKTKTGKHNIIECYNRGTSINHLNASPREYLKRFMANYKKIKMENDDD